MHRNLFALVTLLTVLVAGTEARAACTAGNVNAFVAESTPTGALTDNGDGTVTHSLTGLMWKQCAEGLSGAGCATGAVTTMTWAQALAAAKNSTFAGHSDWRLPNKKELESLVERCGYNPAINQTQFPATSHASPFWSGSTHHQAIANAWGVNFGYGNTTGNDKTNPGHVRLVRSGQSFDYLDAQLNIAYSATTFTELANDGSISNGITLTLSGDTYAADVASANRITASNVPTGLTAHFARDSNTQITATLTGNAAAHANANDIANLTFTFADGAFTNTAPAANVIHYARNNLVVDFADTAAITYSATTFSEAATNDGSISTSITLILSGDTYAATVVSANKITASNVPAGLTANFVRDSNTQITATLTGNAAAHANANDVGNLTFTFVDGAFTNITSAATVTNYARNNLVVDFAEPAIAYSATTFSEAAANDGSISASIALTLSGDTYVADVVSANRVTASFVPAGLTATFVRSSATVIIVLLTGNAAAHANANDIGNLTFAFADGAFANTPTAANVTNYARNNLVVDFDPIASDTTPDAFAFTAQVGVALSAATTSNTITVAGINGAAAITVIGGSYSINGGAYVTGAGTVSNGDTVTVKLTSSASYSTATTATLTIGGVSGAFVGVTQAAASDPGTSTPTTPTAATTPDAFSFTAATGVALNSAVESAAITVTGINSASAISISGGQYAVSTDSGATWGAYTASAGTVNYNDRVKVKLTSSASYSTVVSAMLTIGGVSGAFVSVTRAAPPDPGSSTPATPTTPTTPAAPTAINVTGVEATLTGTTPVNAAPGSTLTIPAGASVSGVSITLTAPVAGTVTVPVTIKVDGTTLTVAPLGATAIVTLKAVTLNGVPTLVLAVSSGMVTVGAPPGQPLLTVSDSGAVVTAGSDGGTVVFHGGGAATLSVTSGYVVLPANAFAAASRRAAVQDDKLYAGEIAQFDADGKVTQVRLGSPAGDGGAVGDPLTPAGFIKAAVPNLHGKVARLSATRMFADLLAAAIGRGATAQGQNSDGVLYFAISGGWASALPVGVITVDTARPDGVTFTGMGNAEVVTSGVVTTLAPAIGDYTRFIGQLAKLDENVILSVLEDGKVRVRLNGVTYVLQPAWTVEPAAGGQDVFSDAQGNFVYQDGAGNRQTLFPAFADQRQLIAAFMPLDAGVTVAANGDGSYRADLLGKSYTLMPDYRLSVTPADQAAMSWWSGADGKLFINYGDGGAQGFGVRIW